MTLVVAGDPGVTTGCSVIDFPEDGEPAFLEFFEWPDPDNVWIEFNALAHRYRDEGYEVVLVIEQFDKRPGIVDPDMTPKYINRDIERYITDFPIVWQIPAQAKNLVKPPGKALKGADQLKRFGWYIVGHRHANDATRHAIVYAVEKLKHKATILRGWPRRGDH